jgi:hypothetical protein
LFGKEVNIEEWFATLVKTAKATVVQAPTADGFAKAETLKVRSLLPFFVRAFLK